MEGNDARSGFSLAAARKGASLSQEELGRLLHKQVRPGEPFSVRASQNLISSWERARSAPKGKQIEALAKILKAPLEDVRAWAERIEPKSPLIRLIDGLAEHSPSLLILVATGSLPGTGVPGFWSSLRSALRGGTSLAVVRPFPGFTTRESGFGIYLAKSVFQFEADVVRLLSETYDQVPVNSIAFFDRPMTHVDIPPFDQTHILTVAFDRVNQDYERSLYLWLGSGNNEGSLHAIEAKHGRRVEAWTQYLQKVELAWERADRRGFVKLNKSTWEVGLPLALHVARGPAEAPATGYQTTITDKMTGRVFTGYGPTERDADREALASLKSDPIPD